MRFFNYEQIWICAHGNPKLMLDIYKRSSTSYMTETNFNFIVNQKALVDAFWLTDRTLAEYLGICSLRSYDDYLINKEVDLSLDLIPTWVPIEVVKNHPLTKPTNSKIILLKEHINGY